AGRAVPRRTFAKAPGAQVDAAWRSSPSVMLLVVIPSAPAFATRLHSAGVSTVQTIASRPAWGIAPITHGAAAGCWSRTRLPTDTALEPLQPAATWRNCGNERNRGRRATGPTLYHSRPQSDFGIRTGHRDGLIAHTCSGLRSCSASRLRARRISGPC